MAKPAPDRLLGLLGLGFKGRLVIIGVDRVREALQAGKLACVVVAADASERAREKVVRLAAARQVPMLDGPTADEIGARLGRPGVMVVGVLDRALALGLASASHGRPKTEA
jgi:ribosomal protein L7Ae-like RNA K-turn-binding protein